MFVIFSYLLIKIKFSQIYFYLIKVLIFKLYIYFYIYIIMKMFGKDLYFDDVKFIKNEF